MIKEKSSQFFVATDKPKESVDVPKFRPFRKIVCYEEIKWVGDIANSIGDLVKDLNTELKKKHAVKELCYTDIHPFDLKNANTIPDTIVKDDISPILLDMYSLRKPPNFDSLFKLIKRKQFLTNAGPRTWIFDRFFILNYVNENLQNKIENLFSENYCVRWPPCSNEDELKRQLTTYMDLFNHPKILPLAGGLSGGTSSPQALEDSIEIIKNAPPGILNSIDMSKIVKIDPYTNAIMEIDKEKSLAEFSPKNIFGKWFLEQFAKRVYKNQEKYIYPNASGFGVLDKTRLKRKESLELSEVESSLQLQIQNMIGESKILNGIINELKDDFVNMGIHPVKDQIRFQISKHLKGIKVLPDQSRSSKKYARTILEGKLLIYLQHEQVIETKEEKNLLLSIGIASLNDVQIFPNTAETLSGLQPVRDLVEIAQVKEINGHLDLVPWKF